ncbi:MAG: CDP-diacylglycerol--glycerol-3-phosphate 3-phosphatidyltransferase [Egibacteraceae bacterium]
MTPRRARDIAFLTRLTLLRIVLILPVMALVLLGPRWSAGFAWAALLFALAALTDLFDGFLARRWRVTTALGAFLDTTADKLLVAAVLVALVAVDRASPWVAVIIIARELAVLGLRGVAATENTQIDPSIWGKLKANVQFAAIVLALLRPDVELGPLLFDEWLMWLAGLVTILSAWEYFSRFAWVLTGSRPGR